MLNKYENFKEIKTKDLLGCLTLTFIKNKNKNMVTNVNYDTVKLGIMS